MTDVALKHQLKIARDTLKMSDIGARCMGGMTKAEAATLLQKHGARVRITKRKKA